MRIPDAAKRAAVRHVKPRLGPDRWDHLRLALSSEPAPPSLTDLAIAHGTDKWGTNHFYTPHYENHLRHLRNERFTLVELGIGGYEHEDRGGASLRMWRDFFPRARIVGLDIVDKTFVADDRIFPYVGSQVDPKVLNRIFSDFKDITVVVDDGSHQPDHVRESFRLIFDRLPSGAIYIIEDTQTSYWPAWGGKVDRRDPSTSMGMVKDLVDGLNYEEFLDEDYVPSSWDTTVTAVHCYHNAVVIEKGENREGSVRDLVGGTIDGQPGQRMD